ncbi:MAG TPA: glycosyl hydrolase family 8, partial [Polyangiaceae bacterium]|nr:glycosyl hydrolase family 8 [Polyangiaceae bacterium]
MTRYPASAALLLTSWFVACGGGDEGKNDLPATGTGGEPPAYAGSGAEAGEPSTAEAGAGGTSGAEPPVSYGGGTLVAAKHGYFPTTVTKTDAEGAYETFRAQRIEDCGANGLRVTTDDPSETLSEGIAHGALLAVGFGDRETFDGIWTYYKKAVAASDAKKSAKHGVMGWRAWADACALQEIHPGAVSGAELDMAMALLQAECRWGGNDYYYAAIDVMNAIRKYMTAEVPAGTVLLPSDMDEYDGCMNASYSAPAYYRVFAKARPEQAEFWTKMADDSYSLLEQATNPTTGLVGDWAPVGGSTCASSDYVGYDAMRTHWRMATDYAWFETGSAKSWLERVTSWTDTAVGAAKLMDVQDGFFTDGSEILGDPGAANSAFVGAFAVGTMPISQKMSDSYHDVVIGVPAANDDNYYGQTGRALFGG